MSNVPDTKSTDGVPTYLARGDPAGRFADYHPACGVLAKQEADE
jgi:hypothetical protein